MSAVVPLESYISDEVSTSKVEEESNVKYWDKNLSLSQNHVCFSIISHIVVMG